MKWNPQRQLFMLCFISLAACALMLMGCASSGVVAVPLSAPCTKIIPQPIGPLPVDALTEASTSAQIIQALWQTVQIQQRYIQYRNR